MNTHVDKILIGPSSFAAVDKTPLNRLLAAGFEVVHNPFGRKLTRNELIDLLPGVTGLIAGLETLDREVMELSGLKVISRCGSGMSNVDQEAARNLGIKVYCTPDGPTNSVAELTVGMMISLTRGIPQMDRALHEGKWAKQIGFQLEGKTVVIIGFGRIGRMVAGLLQSFGPRLVVVEPYMQHSVANVETLFLDEALPQADVISIHASGEMEILGEKEFALIKPGTFLLNASRGSQVNEPCLIHALEKGDIAGVWLDAFSQEPYNGPLRQFPQVVLTPHIGSYSVQCRKRMEMEAVENLLSALVPGSDRLCPIV